MIIPTTIVESSCGCGLIVDGSKQVVEASNKNVREIFDEIDLYCSQIESKYEEQGKSID